MAIKTSSMTGQEIIFQINNKSTCHVKRKYLGPLRLDFPELCHIMIDKKIVGHPLVELLKINLYQFH